MGVAERWCPYNEDAQIRLHLLSKACQVRAQRTVVIVSEVVSEDSEVCEGGVEGRLFR